MARFVCLFKGSDVNTGSALRLRKKNRLDFWTVVEPISCKKLVFGFQDGEKEEGEQEEGLKEEEGVWVRLSSRLNPCQGSVK